MAYAMFLNLFLLGAELFKEFYSATEHLLYTRYLLVRHRRAPALVPYAWLLAGLQRGRLPALPRPAHAHELRRRSTSAAC